MRASFLSETSFRPVRLPSTRIRPSVRSVPPVVDSRPSGALERRHAERLEIERQTALMARFRDRRDPSDFDALYAAAQGHLLSWIVQRMAAAGIEGDPLELLQDTFVNIYRYAGSFRDEPGNTFRGWARTIAANAVRRTRGRRRIVLSYQALPTGASEPEDERETPSELLDRGEQRRAVGRAWILLLLHYAKAADQLSARDQEALHLVEVEGLPYSEVARRLRVRSSNMKMIVFRSRKRIRAHMLQAFARSEGGSGREILAEARRAG